MPIERAKPTLIAGDSMLSVRPATEVDVAPLGTGLDVGATIGQGGSAIVRRAIQRSLAREVAVKTLRPEVDATRGRSLLLREARVTGGLQHPGVIPVHDVVHDPVDDELQIVMKRVEGDSWLVLMKRPIALEAHFPGREPIDAHLDILIRLCRVLEYAHDRGILHRDIKPENVMLGRFGELYLLDWGLALRTDPRGNPDVPHVDDVAPVLAGTPAYMAPEMLGEGGKLGTWTDVFLLGATLYEVVFGEPPYAGLEGGELHDAIRGASPDFEGADSDWLTAITRRAMQRDPEHRYESVAELRRALENYQQARGAWTLTRDALAYLKQLELRVAEPDSEEDKRRELYVLHGQAVFGFQQALRHWEHEEAEEGLAKTHVVLATWELEQGDPEAALRLLADLDPVPAELWASARSSLEQKQAEQDELRALKREYDPRVGRRNRLYTLLGFAAVWVAAPMSIWLFADPEQAVAEWTLPGSLAFLLVVLAVSLVRRDEVLGSHVNRVAMGSLAVIFAAQVALDVAALIGGWSMVIVHTNHLLLWAVVSSVTAFTLSSRLWWVSSAYLVGYFVALVWPTTLLPVIAATNAFLIVVARWMWADDVWLRDQLEG